MADIENNSITIDQSRWKSYVLWSSIIAQLLVLADALGLWAKFGIERSVFTVVIDCLLQLMVIAGVINNPTDKARW